MTNSLLQSVADWADIALGFIYPDVCQMCAKQRATAKQGYVCEDCRTGTDGIKFVTLPFCKVCGLPFEGEILTEFECSNCREMDLHFSSAQSAAIYSGVVRDAIHLYKYQRALCLEPFLGELLVNAAKPELEYGQWEVIVPVPLHANRMREREFNQAERLARCLSKTTGISLNTQSLIRIQATETQTRLSRVKRAENMRKAFAVENPEAIKGKRVVVVDDVLTTGATTSGCAEALKRAGADDVCVWSVARGI